MFIYRNVDISNAAMLINFSGVISVVAVDMCFHKLLAVVQILYVVVVHNAIVMPVEVVLGVRLHVDS